MLQSMVSQGSRHGLVTKHGREEPPHVRGQGQKPGGPMPEGRQPRGVTPRLRSGAAAESTRLRRRRNHQEELPHVRIHGGRPRGDTQPARSGVATEELPRIQVRGGSREELPHAPTPEARGCGWEDQPHVQGAFAAPAQEGLEELSHIEGQEGRW